MSEHKQGSLGQNHVTHSFLGDEYWESRIFSALSVILIGIILLLNSTGTLSWEIWLNMFKFWPLFIVSLGISIIFGGSRLMKFIGSGINFLIFLGVVVLAAVSPFSLNWNIFSGLESQAQTAQYMVSDSDYTNITSKTLDLDIPIGKVNVQDEDAKFYLDQETTYFSDNEKLTVDQLSMNGNLNLKFSLNSTSNIGIITHGPRYSFTLGQLKLPADLKLKIGAGSGEIVLSKQSLRDLNLETGVGSLNVQLSADSIPSGIASLKTGVGSITFKIPSFVGIKINYKVGLGSLSFNNMNLSSGGGNSTYTSSNFNSASSRMELSVDVGLGSILIVTQ